MCIVNTHMCVGIVGMNKNAYKVCIVWLSKHQKKKESNAQDRSTLLVFSAVAVFSLVLCVFVAGLLYSSFPFGSIILSLKDRQLCMWKRC